MRRFFKGVLTVFGCWILFLFFGSFLWDGLSLDSFRIAFWELSEGARLPDIAGIAYAIALGFFAVLYRLFYWIVDPKANGDRERVKSQEIFMFYGIGGVLCLAFGFKVLTFSNPESIYLAYMMGIIPLAVLLLSGIVLKKPIQRAWMVEALKNRKLFVRKELASAGLTQEQVDARLKDETTYDDFGRIKDALESLGRVRDRTAELEEKLVLTQKALISAKDNEERLRTFLIKGS